MITDNVEMQGAFLPGLRKIGRFTSRATGTIARAFLPPGLVDVAAKFDPTKKKGFAQAKQSAADLLTPKTEPLPKQKPKFSLNPTTIGIGIAAIGALLLIGKRK